MSRARLVQTYYALTPVFALIDVGLGVSMRASGIANTSWRLVYYAFAVACWFAMRRRPRWTPLIGIGEGAVTLFLLIWGVMGPIFALQQTVAGGGEVVLGFGMAQIANLLLSGSIVILSIHGHQAALANPEGPLSRR